MHILYVEDDAYDVELTLREMARSAPSHEMENVSTIQAARELLEAAPDRFDLIMIDLNLPDGSGVDLLTYVRGRELPIAAVVVTGAGDEEMAVALLKAGAEDYIVKNEEYLRHLAVILESALQRYRSDRARRARTLAVIYADANHDDLELARLHLSRFAPHIQVTPLTRAADVYNRLDAGHYDALVVDYRLPDANGLDVLKEIHQVRRIQIPVLIVTGSGSEDVAAQALKLGAADYMVKTQGYVFRLPSAIENAVAQARLVRDQAALRESEARFRRLAENAPDLIFRLQIRPEQRFEYASPAAFKMVGYSPEEFYADPDLLGKLVYQDDLPLLERFRSGSIQQGETILMRWVRKDGRVIWVELRFSNVYNLEGAVVAVEGIVRDVTGQREVEAEMQRQLQRLASLRSIDQAISNSFDLKLVLVVLIDKVTSEMKVDAASILLYNPINQMLEHSAGSGFRSRLVDTMAVRVGEAYAGQAMYERRVIHFPSPDLPELSRDTARLIAEEGFQSGVFAPLVTKGEVKGVMQLFSRGQIRAEASWLGFLEVLASQAAIAIDNAELFQNLQRSNQDLKVAYDSMLEGWVRAMDARRHETRDHNRGVTRLAMELAQQMRVNPEELSDIRRGSMLHDIGMLALPDAVVFKPAPLSAEEWQMLRQHPRLALEMLAPITSLSKVMDIPYSHHEKWDGSGYPRGLKGEYIPFAARLFAVCDVWDSMLSEKPYRPPLSRDEALAYIRSQAGMHFDPDVVAAFLKMAPA